MKDDLADLIIEVAQEILEGEGAPSAALDHETVLFGKEGLFDSLGLVSLIVAVEQEIEDRLGSPIALADEKAFSQSSSPYRTVRTLASFATGLVEDR
jgi:acyl carrier protein